MPRASRRAMRFVRALGTGSATRLKGNTVVVAVAGTGERTATLDLDEVCALVADGVIAVSGDGYRPTAEARSWLRRQLCEADDFAGQHRELARNSDGGVVNLAESPLARLAMRPPHGAPFLAPHHVEAGERVRRLAERARLQPRVTMSYDAARTAGGTRNTAADITETAAAARKALSEIPRVLPADCAGVVLDVCGLLKGLQVVESERGWPRRSAKLVLRIGLEQLARSLWHFGRGRGPASARGRTWLSPGARPERFE